MQALNAGVVKMNVDTDTWDPRVTPFTGPIPERPETEAVGLLGRPIEVLQGQGR